MRQLLGIVLLLTGIYLLGQNIMFSTYYSPYFWRNLPALGSVLSIVGGVICLVWFPRQTQSLGWLLLGAGVLLVFLSGGVLLRPTSLWSFLVAMIAMTAGYKLMSGRRLRF